MTRLHDCRTVRERLDEVAAGSSTEFEAHLRDCAGCSDLVRRDRSLVRLLSRQPRAPAATFPAPALPDAPAGRTARIRRASWIAAAAAALLVAVLWHVAEPSRTRVRIDSVVDVADAPPPSDERLLALTAGIEAVAMRRPTEQR